MTDYVELKPKHRGAHSELRAALWLLDRGYEVFRNISAHGAVDLVGIKDGVIELFDVKTGRGQTLSTEAQELGVKVLVVDGNDVWIYPRRELPFDPKEIIRAPWYAEKRRAIMEEWSTETAGLRAG